MITHKQKSKGGEFTVHNPQGNTIVEYTLSNSIGSVLCLRCFVKCGEANTQEDYNEYPLCRPKAILDKLTKPEIKSLLKPGAQPTPIDYKKMEILLNEKNTEIQCLQEEVQGLTARINEITAVHE